MVKSALADESLKHYLTSLAKDNKFTIGLILGQSTVSKDYVVHFAKTPFQNHIKIESLSDINENWLTDHAKNVSRMLPGGMYVLGLFIVSNDDHATFLNPKIKVLLTKIYRVLNDIKYLFTSPDNEKLLLNYCKKTQQIITKSYDIITCSVNPVEFKFLQKPTKWLQVNCCYKINEIHNIDETETDCPLKNHMSIILNKVNIDLDRSTFLYDNDVKDGEDYLENYSKTKKLKDKHNEEDETEKCIQVKILQPLNEENSIPFKISDYNNQIRIDGQVVSKLFFHSKVTISDTTKAVIEDIMRSLATRLEMHWDSLIEEEHGEDLNSVHEPPRRVMLALPNSKIMISDYLFPGEGGQEAQVSIEEMLDIKIYNKSDIKDVEGQTNLTQYYNEVDIENEEVKVKKPMEKKRNYFIYICVVATMVVFLSIVIHIFME